MSTTEHLNRSLLLCVLIVLSTGCRDKFDKARVLGGVEVSAAVLNKGHAVYRSLCARCHGSTGKGRKTVMLSARKPRNLTDGKYKFSSVIDNGLPTDADLARTVTRGLKGQLMPGFVRLPKDRVHAVVQYIKTLSQRWSEERQGKGIQIPEDPWKTKAKAVAHGQVVYSQIAKCASCHPGKVMESDYGPLRSPDLAKDELVGIFDAQDVYRAVAVGLPGTGMPAYGDSLSSRQIWALAHYVLSMKK